MNGANASNASQYFSFAHSITPISDIRKTLERRYEKSFELSEREPTEFFQSRTQQLELGLVQRQ